MDATKMAILNRISFLGGIRTAIVNIIVMRDVNGTSDNNFASRRRAEVDHRSRPAAREGYPRNEGNRSVSGGYTVSPAQDTAAPPECGVSLAQSRVAPGSCKAATRFSRTRAGLAMVFHGSPAQCGGCHAVTLTELGAFQRRPAADMTDYVGREITVDGDAVPSPILRWVVWARAPVGR
jgi:hypothetical protein